MYIVHRYIGSLKTSELYQFLAYTRDNTYSPKNAKVSNFSDPDSNEQYYVVV